MMSNKNRQTDSNSRRHNWLDVFARTRRSSSDSNSDQQWQSEVPNIKLSRAFVVVLILHVIAVGGILAFEMFKPKARNSSLVTSEQENNEIVSEIQPDAENDIGYERYIVRNGDSLRTIAESYKISRTELLAANLIDEDHPLVSGRILRVPKLSLVVNKGEEFPIPSQSGNEDYILLDKFQFLKSVPPVETSEVVPRAIPVSKINSVRPPKIVKEISTSDFIVTGNELKGQLIASTYTISSGDTLYGIARKYKISVDSILKLNPGVDPRTLGIGKTLRLP